MAEANTGTNSVSPTDVQALLAQLAEARATASAEDRLTIDQGIVALNSNLSQDERNKARKAQREEALAEKNA